MPVPISSCNGETQYLCALRYTYMNNMAHQLIDERKIFPELAEVRAHLVLAIIAYLICWLEFQCNMNLIYGMRIIGCYEIHIKVRLDYEIFKVIFTNGCKHIYMYL